MSAERAVALRSRSSSIGGGTRVRVWPGLPPPPRACRGPPARTGCSWRSGTGRARGQVGGRGLLLGQSDGRDPQAPEACLEAAGRGWRPPTPSGRGCRELLQSACASVGCAASPGSAGSASPCSEAARWRLRVSGVSCVGSADNRGPPGPPQGRSPPGAPSSASLARCRRSRPRRETHTGRQEQRGLGAAAQLSAGVSCGRPRPPPGPLP